MEKATIVTHSLTVTPAKYSLFLVIASLVIPLLSAAEVGLAWDPNTEPDVAGYRIYYTELPGTEPQVADAGNATSITIPNLLEGRSYSFHATCYSTAGLESDPSNTVEYTVPVTNPENQPPVAQPRIVATAEDTAVDFVLEGTDMDGDLLTFAVASGPSQGSLSATAPNLTYTPFANFHGSDSFTFKVNDGTVDSALATVSITVTPVNDAPTAPSALAAAAGDRSVQLTWAAATDPDGDTPDYDIYRRTAGGSYGLPIARVSALSFHDTGLMNDTIYYYAVRSVDSGGLGFDSTEVSVTPNAQAHNAYVVQDPLVTSGTLGDGGYLSTRLSGDGQVQTLQEKRVGQDVLLLAEYLLRTSADPTQITGLTLHLVTSTSTDSDLYEAALWNFVSGTWEDISGAIEGGTYAAVGDPRRLVNSMGEIRMRFTDSNRGDRYEPADVMSIDLLYAEISVVQVTNLAPMADAQSRTTLEDTTLSLVLTGSDPESDSLMFAIVSGPSHGTLTGIAPDLAYTPAQDFNGSDSFTFKVNDGRSDSAPAPVSLSITPVNDPPTVKEKTVKTPKGNPIRVELIASDPDGDPLTFEIVSNPSYGTLSGTGPEVTYTPSPGYVGVDEFSFVASDGQLESGTAPVSILIEEDLAELRIMSTVLTDYGVILSWASTEGTAYRVLYKPSLSDPTWLMLGETVGAIGTMTSYADRLVEQGQTLRYYLVEQVP